MQLAEGVLLVLDPEATPFTRIWCAFEEATVVDGALPLLLDIATVTGFVVVKFSFFGSTKFSQI